MTRRDRMLLMAVGTIGVLLIWYFYVYSPRQAEYRRLRADLTARQEQLARMEATVKQIAQLEAEYARLQSFIAEIEAKLPAEKETPTLLVQLERLARAVGIDLQAIRPGQLQAGAPAAPAGGGRPSGGQQPARAPAGQQPPPAAAYLRFPIGLSIQATFADILEVASRLNNFPRLIIVRRLNLQPRSGTAPDAPELSINMDIETYVLPREAR